MNFTTTYPPKFPRPAIGGYRYFFNGQESDGEVYGQGSLAGYEFRQYDTRLGRWWGIDRKATKYPSLSPYQFCADDPITMKDVDGSDFVVVIDNSGEIKTITIQMNIYSNTTEAYDQLLPAVNEINSIVKAVTIDDMEYYLYFEIRAIEPDESAHEDFLIGQPTPDIVSFNAYTNASADNLMGVLFWGTMPGTKKYQTSTNDFVKYAGGETQGNSFMMYHGPNNENFGNSPQLVSHEILHLLGLSDEGGPFYSPGGRMEYIATPNNNFKMLDISNDDIKNILRFVFLYNGRSSSSSDVSIDYTEGSESIIPNPNIEVK